MKKNINFSSRVMNVFDEMGSTYDEVKNLMYDLYKGELDGDVSRKEAEEQIREMTRKIFGVTKDSSKRDRQRAYREYGRQFFDIIEEVLDWTVTTGLKENEWFNALVIYRNLAEGDENLFVNAIPETVLSVAKLGKRHHDTILQRLPEKTTYKIDTDIYSVAIGADIDKYIIGQVDWSEMLKAITRTYVDTIQDLCYAAVLNAYQKLPVQAPFVKSGALNADHRKEFNKLLEKVSAVNDNADVIIMGTMSALGELENLVRVNWVSDYQKESVAANNRLGNYGRYQLVEIPQRTVRNDVATDKYRDDLLFIFAVQDNKLVDMVDIGETIIDEITERGEGQGRIDDMMKYEVQREFGVATRFGRYFGQWTITED